MTPTPLDEPYHESADYTWTEKAFEMLEHNDLHGEVISRNRIVRSRVWGPCPRCKHDLDDQQTHTAVTSLMGGQWGDPRGTDPGKPISSAEVTFFPIDVSCRCGASHPGAPAGQAGCGVSFRVELPLHAAASSDQS